MTAWEILVRFLRFFGIDLDPSVGTDPSSTNSNRQPLLRDAPATLVEADLESGSGEDNTAANTPVVAEPVAANLEVVSVIGSEDAASHAGFSDAAPAAFYNESQAGFETPPEAGVADNHDVAEAEAEAEGPLDRTLTDVGNDDDGVSTPTQQGSPKLAIAPLTPGNLQKLNEVGPADAGASASASAAAVQLPSVKAILGGGAAGDIDDDSQSQSSAGNRSGVSISKAHLSEEQIQTLQLGNNNGLVAIRAISMQRMASRPWTQALAHAGRQESRKGKSAIGIAATDFAPGKKNLLNAIQVLGTLKVNVHAEWWLRATAQASYLGPKHTDKTFPFYGALDEGVLTASQTKTQFNAAKEAWEKNYIARVTINSRLGLTAPQDDKLVNPIKIGLPSHATAIYTLKAQLSRTASALTARLSQLSRNTGTLSLFRNPLEIENNLKDIKASIQLLETLQTYLLPQAGQDTATGFTYEDWLTLNALSTKVTTSEFFGSLKHAGTSTLFVDSYKQWEESALSAIQQQIGLAPPKVAAARAGAR